ncbi:hypothetical protein EVAR_12764_1 [Eumeta japonica]|uniref:Uncharacterized protein n=1 Tax=Eumeta variegata TaxID=151549 RepID=A0A4C1UC15_EUMVA|nr:hypothetical protein EVAR_12764_1 [Eumeta japonica]
MKPYFEKPPPPPVNGQSQPSQRPAVGRRAAEGAGGAPWAARRYRAFSSTAQLTADTARSSIITILHLRRRYCSVHRCDGDRKTDLTPIEPVAMTERNKSRYTKGSVIIEESAGRSYRRRLDKPAGPAAANIWIANSAPAVYRTASAQSRSKRADDPSENTWSPPPMKTRNFESVTSDLPASCEGTRYLMERNQHPKPTSLHEKIDGCQRGREICKDRTMRKCMVSAYPSGKQA